MAESQVTEEEKKLRSEPDLAYCCAIFLSRATNSARLVFVQCGVSSQDLAMLLFLKLQTLAGPVTETLRIVTQMQSGRSAIWSCPLDSILAFGTQVAWDDWGNARVPT